MIATLNVIKEFWFISFENSSLSFVFVRILLSRLKRRFEMNSRDDTNEVIDNITSEVWEGEDECTKEQKKEFMKLMLWCISLYVSRSPISSIIVILLVMIWAIAKLVSNGLKVNSVESGLSEFGKSLKTH